MRTGNIFHSMNNSIYDKFCLQLRKKSFFISYDKSETILDCHMRWLQWSMTYKFLDCIIKVYTARFSYNNRCNVIFYQYQKSFLSLSDCNILHVFLLIVWIFEINKGKKMEGKILNHFFFRGNNNVLHKLNLCQFRI